MEIDFFQIPGWDCWFTTNSPYTIFEWAQQYNIKYRTEHHVGSTIGISLLDEHSKIYFQLRWGGSVREVWKV